MDRYRCPCGAPWMTVVGRHEVSSSVDDWRICPTCDGAAASTALLPDALRRDRGAIDDA